ncbi:intracellular ribonuclease LX-like [Malania oleifera]|uniref:intracellular ribonuclease LX-like n=1 Tax=Malania oleifera TaxID=397392 RepID=UPI0025ADA667|nr:intracellular ribonuclease LX-like [Malania oleifera]
MYSRTCTKNTTYPQVLMKMPPLLFIAIFILSLLLSPASPQHPTVDENNQKLLKLAISWPTSLCNGKTNCKHNDPPDRFSIHGPWPLYRDPLGPNAVDWSTFPVITEAKMKIDWASYGTATNRKFWDHEWSKHGRVSGLLPPAYFELGLTLFDRVNLGNHLKSEGTYPEGQTVNNKDFTAAVSKAAGGKNVILLCNKDKQGVTQLYEIDICFDLTTHAHAYVNCDSSKSSCPDRFRLTKANSIRSASSTDSPVHAE